MGQITVGQFTESKNQKITDHGSTDDVTAIPIELGNPGYFAAGIESELGRVVNVICVNKVENLAVWIELK